MTRTQPDPQCLECRGRGLVYSGHSLEESRRNHTFWRKKCPCTMRPATIPAEPKAEKIHQEQQQ